MKNKKNVLVLIILGSLLFVWYELVPFLVRRNCAERSLMEGHYETSIVEKESMGFDTRKSSALEVERLNNWYMSCVHDFGLPN